MKTTLLAFCFACLLLAACRSDSRSIRRASDLVILKATYGVGTSKIVDVTDEIRSLAKSGSIHLYPQWGLGVDPAYGATKRVTVAYKYKGQVGVASYDQFEEFVLPAGQ